MLLPDERMLQLISECVAPRVSQVERRNDEHTDDTYLEITDVSGDRFLISITEII